MLHKKRCRRLFFLFSLCFLFSLTIYSQKLIKNKDYFVSYQHDSGTEEYTKNAYLMFEDGKHKNYIKEDVNSSTLDQKKKKIIQIDDFQDLIETEDFRLTLITCTGNPNTRLLVIAKRL